MRPSGRPRSNDIVAYFPKEHWLRRLSAPGATVYPVPIDEHIEGSVPEEFAIPPRLRSRDAQLSSAHHGSQVPALPGSSPGLLSRHVLDDTGAEYAVLLPLTRGLVSDPGFKVAIAAATNQWLAESWLGEWNADGRFKGSIRVCRRPDEAVAEIRRWAGHEHLVQVAVPLEAHQSYGEQMYFPIWKAAAEHGLPVAIHSDHSGGILAPPTSVGYPIYALEAYSQSPIYGLTHLSSFIGHGVFDRLSSLVIVFADGGFDYLATLMWRLDKDWRSTRAEVLWMTKAPSSYLAANVRYVVHRSDGALDHEQYTRFIEPNHLGAVLTYGSTIQTGITLRRPATPSRSTNRSVSGSSTQTHVPLPAPQPNPVAA